MTSESTAFLSRLQAGLPLDDVLQPSLDNEVELRRLFATDKINARLQDPYVGLVDVFGEGTEGVFTTHARAVQDDESDLAAKYVMPLSPDQRRASGTPCIVPDLDSFRKNWAIFSESSLSQLLDWNNVVAAGGSVLACLTPLPENATLSKRATRKFYHSNTYPTSDVDLFLWGLTPEEAEAKIVKIYEAVRDSVPWDCTCVRTKHTISIHSQYPYRSVQIVLRLYSSVSEILTGFDIDAPSCAYDGTHVWANPRALVAMMRQCNTVDMTRRSPSYEVRLAKYAARAFEVYVPTLSRKDVDPTIYERSIARIEGLARLLVFEKIKDTNDRDAFLQNRRMLRGRPNENNYRRQRRQYKGDLKDESGAIGGLEMNDYDVASLHIPYGPGWDARRIEKLVYQTDLGMNSTFNPKNKGRRLHRHPAFFGTIEECLEDCCEFCPEAIDGDERKLLEEEDKKYIRGRISFIEEDPGRQSMTGSFNPIDVGEWSEQVYIGPLSKFFNAIAAGDREAITSMLTGSEPELDLNRRDHVGRTSLHLAIICRHADIALDLIDRGARISARLVDGRSPLHLAAQYDLLEVVKRLLEKSKANEEELKKKSGDEGGSDEGEDIKERASSQDDWTSEDDGVISLDDEDEEEAGDDEDDDETEDGDGEEEADGDDEKPTSKPADPEIAGDGALDDSGEEPDVLDVNVPDWDLDFAPLMFAILYASPPLVATLLAAGASITQVSKGKYYRAPALHPLSLTILRDDDDAACAIADVLLKAGAVSSTADSSMYTVFHEAVAAGKTKLVRFLLSNDPKALSVIQSPSIDWNSVFFPLGTAITAKDPAMVVTLAAYGASLIFKEEDVEQALVNSRHSSKDNGRRRLGNNNAGDAFKNVQMPLECAMGNRDDMVHLLLALGANPNGATKSTLRPYGDDMFTFFTYARWAKRKVLKDRPKPVEEPATPPTGNSWKVFHAKLLVDKSKGANEEEQKRAKKERKQIDETAAYFADMEKLLQEHGGKPWNEVFRDRKQPENNNDESGDDSDNPTKPERYLELTTSSWSRIDVPKTLNDLYDELYEACYAGDNGKIEELCLPAEVTTDRHLLSMSVTTNDGARVTPLYAAVCGRHWNTVQLVFSIIGAQYEKDENEDNHYSPNVNFYDDSDDDASDISYESDDTVEEHVFVDLTSRPSKVKSSISQKVYLDETRMNVVGGNINIIYDVIHKNDFEAFRHILKLYTIAKDEPIPLNDAILSFLVTKDRPDMLDEFIRRSGLGLLVESHHDEEQEVARNDRNRVYLGLTVHGKKRGDLAKKGDPNAMLGQNGPEEPFVWRAAHMGATAVVQYLASDRPLAAYKHYSITHNDALAVKIRRANQSGKLETILPAWLGWKVNALGESPYAAAVLSGKLETIKAVFNVKAPGSGLPKTAIHNRIKFIGSNLLGIAIQTGCKKEVVEFLFARGIDPTVIEQTKGWNVLHITCADWRDSNIDVLEYLLKKLPKDTSETMLCQPSKTRQDTPLHLAVKSGKPAVVKLILDFSLRSLDMSNVDGFTPLHTAVSSGFADTVRLLISAHPELIQRENGVGNTALEMADAKFLQNRLTDHTDRKQNGNSTDLSNYLPTHIARHSPGKEGLVRLRTAVDALVADGKASESLIKAVDGFVKAMEARPKNPEDPVDEKIHVEQPDPAKVHLALLDAVGQSGLRSLVHLVDVQRSVQGNLRKFVKEKGDEYVLPNDDELEPEMADEVKERIGSMVIRAVRWAPETY